MLLPAGIQTQVDVAGGIGGVHLAFLSADTHLPQPQSASTTHFHASSVMNLVAKMGNYVKVFTDELTRSDTLFWIG